jgi:hypothetical protein
MKRPDNSVSRRCCGRSRADLLGAVVLIFLSAGIYIRWGVPPAQPAGANHLPATLPAFDQWDPGAPIDTAPAPRSPTRPRGELEYASLRD